MQNEKLFDTAVRLLQNNFSVIPIKIAQKKPTLKQWESFKSNRPTLDDISFWFEGGQHKNNNRLADLTNEPDGIAIVTGAISGNLLCIDIDSKNDPLKDDPVNSLSQRIAKAIRRDLGKYLNDPTFASEQFFQRLYIERSQNGGFHILFRCTHPVGRSECLARSADKTVLIETRGEGGYIIVAPTPGYENLDEDIPLDQLPLLTPEIVDALLRLLRDLFDEYIEPMPEVRFTPPLSQRTTWGEGNSPFEVYNREEDFLQILANNGWKYRTRGHTNGRTRYELLRPGKSWHQGISGTVRWMDGVWLFHCFTSSTEFNNDRSYLPHQVFAKLECNDDNKRAHRELLHAGYGENIFTDEAKEKHEKRQQRELQRREYPKELSRTAERTIERTIERTAERTVEIKADVVIDGIAVDGLPQINTTQINTTQINPVDAQKLSEVSDSPTVPTVQSTNDTTGSTEHEDEFIMQCLLDSTRGDGRLLRRLADGLYVYDQSHHKDSAWVAFKGNWTRHEGVSVLSWASDILRQTYKAFLLRIKDKCVELEDALRTASPDKQEYLQKSIKFYAEVLDIGNKTLSILKQPERITKALRFAVSDGLWIKGTEWDSNPYLLGVANGVIDLRADAPTRFRPYAPKDYIVKHSPVEWQGIDTPCHRWEQFIREIFNETEGHAPLGEFIQMLFGYGITGLTTEHIYPIFYGEKGRNGKDTLMETIAAVLGRELCSPVSQDIVIESRGKSRGSHSAEIYDLMGKRIAFINETSETDRINAASLKSATGGGAITCRPINGAQISFTPSHLLLLLTNHKPHISAYDEALWRRLALVEFNQQFVENPDPNDPNQHLADKNLKSILAEELPGILAWLVRGCIMWQERGGLQRPAIVQAQSASYRKESDEIFMFIEDCCTLNPALATPTGELYARYKSWSIETKPNGRLLSMTAFGYRLKDVKGIEKVDNCGARFDRKGYSGIALR